MTEENTSQSIQPGPPKFKVGQRVALQDDSPQEVYINNISCKVGSDEFKRDWSGNTCKCTESTDNKDINGTMLCTERKFGDSYTYTGVNIPQSIADERKQSQVASAIEHAPACRGKYRDAALLTCRRDHIARAEKQSAD